MISIQTQDFDISDEYGALREGQNVGAIVTFTGLVREFIDPQGKHTEEQTLYIEHYPGMAEHIISTYVEKAHSRWNINRIRIVHRVGDLKPNDQIVFVGASSQHRQEAFNAAMYVMDQLKTQAPFWKKENDHWVDCKTSDTKASERWRE